MRIVWGPAKSSKINLKGIELLENRPNNLVITGREPFPGEMLRPSFENILLSSEMLDRMVDYYIIIYEMYNFQKPFGEEIDNSIIICIKMNQFGRCQIADEEIDDINELQDEYESESVSSEEKCPVFDLEEGDKRADTEDVCERESVKSNCSWNINLWLTGGLVYITLLCNEHNHFLAENKNLVLNRQLGPEIFEEIQFLVNVGCEAGPIIRALQKCFPETVIHPKNRGWRVKTAILQVFSG
ncbi:hypothetical protein C1645_811219 [Glomus cerebriforme]|uniref:FAR1 domain-containing protein n=1 Tax=Glomus cerebriforme TaxID=658196 RepID=A0A397TNU7_9GLOM|nr:hypothetical protein C1645_811219 [Glomus cerebriforme]